VQGTTQNKNELIIFI